MSEPEEERSSLGVNRRDFFRTTALGGALALVAGPGLGGSAASAQPAASSAAVFELEELSVAELQAGMESGRWTARSLAMRYLARIEALDVRGPTLRSVIELNPDALSIAAELDQERQAKGPRGPMHGIPVLIKDNIDTADRMQTTAGSLALAGTRPAKDSFVVQRLRAAGAVILGKTNLSEWANIRASRSTSGWSARGGLTKNPYVLDRNPCGSSSGSGTAISANLAAVAVGTETDGSIVCPASATSLVGFKPTLGLVSRTGIIPIAHSQDTAGPMARSVADAAVLLGALAGVDPDDPITETSRGKAHADYTKFLDPDGLRGARIGVTRQFSGFNQKVDALIDACLEQMKQLGAVLIDPVKITTAGQFDDSELVVLLYELKDGLDRYLAGRGPDTPVRSLQDVIEFNEKHKDKEMPHFGQDLFLQAQAKGPLTSPEYRKALAKNHKLSRKLGIDAVMAKHKLDAMVAPTGGPAWPTDLINGDHFTGGFSSAAAVAGYPHVTVPAGYVHGLPIGISFFGGAYSEPVLLRLAFAFEQATKHRRPPRFLPSVELGG